MKTLAKKPADRYDTAIDMMTAFKQACAEVGLMALPDNRDKVAEQSFSRMEKGLLEDSPTVSTETPAKAASKTPPPGIPSPLPPQPAIPVPPEPMSRHDQRAAEREARRKTRQVEWEMNFNNSADWKKLGDQIKQQVERGANWAEGLGSSIEQAAKEGARQAAYEANTPKPRISDEAQIRERIEKRYKERSGVIAHAIPFLLVNLVLWSIYFGSPGSGFPWPMFVTFFWGIGMVSHFFAYWNKYGGGADQRERAIQREIEQERERSLMYEKPKNDERDVRMRLTDDGELEEVPDDEISQAQKRKRNS
jgi:hypothetical protein